jgi:hypothetical protein
MLSRSTRKTRRNDLEITCCKYEKKATDPLDPCTINGPLYKEKNNVAFHFTKGYLSVDVLNHAFKHTESVKVPCYNENKLRHIIKDKIEKGIVYTYDNPKDKTIEFANSTNLYLKEYTENIRNKHKITLVCRDKKIGYVLITCHIQKRRNNVFITIFSVTKGKKENGKLINVYEKGGSD